MRLLIRSALLAAATVAALGAVPWEAAPLVVPAISPYVVFAGAIAQCAATWATLLGAPVLLIALFRHRWFCRNACPVGLVTEYAGRWSPMPKSTCRKLPNLGPWITLMTLAGACVGYPLLLWLDPLAIFSGFFGVFGRPWSAAVALPALGLPILVVLSFLIPGAWCLRLCPLGATQELVVLTPKKGAGVFSAESAPSAPDDLQEAGPRRALFRRRTVVALGLGAAWAVAALRVLRGRASVLIRPPGAADEAEFTGLCVRCGNCIRACPSGILAADLGEHGIASLLTPVARFAEDYCRETCHRCTQVCPSGAIARLSLAEKNRARMGLAQVDMAICVLGDDRECQVCRNHCPYEAIQILWSDESYTNAPRVDPQRCNGCGACEAACITSPQKAIRVMPISSSSPSATEPVDGDLRRSLPSAGAGPGDLPG